jgi:hypothetical protein
MEIPPVKFQVLPVNIKNLPAKNGVSPVTVGFSPAK